MQRTCTVGLVYNPAAGSGRWRPSVERVCQALKEAGGDVELFPTSGPGDGIEQARRAALAHPVVAVLGGDGSVNEVLNGVVASGRSRETEVLLLPRGTMNVLCRDLHIPLNAVRAARLLATGAPRTVYLGRAGERYFVLMASAGVDSSIVHYMNCRSGLKRLLGPWAFALEGFRHFWAYRFPPIEVTIADGPPQRAYSVVIGKSRGYGGWFSVTPGADVSRPDFQVAVCTGHNVFVYPWYLALALAGRLDRSRDYRFYRATRLVLNSTQPVHLQIDGDSAGELPREFLVDGSFVRVLCAPAVR